MNSCLFCIPTFGFLAGFFRKAPKPVNLDAAMYRIASVIAETDTFCVTDERWRHGGSDRYLGKGVWLAHFQPARYTVTLFRRDRVAVQKAGNALDSLVDMALDEYRTLVIQFP